MSVIDELLANANAYAETFAGGELQVSPVRKLAVVACMDSRLDIFAMLGLDIGDAHVIRNAGGVITEDTIRSLVISQRLLATEEIVLIHHSDCGLLRITDDEFADALEADTGRRPGWSAQSFRDAAQDVRESIARIMDSPFIPSKHSVRGFVFDDRTGRLSEIPPA